MERHLYEKLLSWKRQSARKPLLLQGARQVGKTWLLKTFGEREYADLAYFNFEEFPELGDLFCSSLSPKTLVESLSAVIGRKIQPERTLVFLDEVQAAPKALTSLKYFCEEAPEYHVASAGSLLGVSVGRGAAFPVGKVNFLTLFPMSFLEYLKAAGEDVLAERLMNKKDRQALPGIFHEKLSTLFKFFLFLGGMPEVVRHYLEHRDLRAARRIQGEILNAFERDFSKHTTKSESMRISEIWRSLPSQLARENKKFKYSAARKGGRASQFESAVEWLRRCGLVYLAFNLRAPKLPLAGYADASKFKMYMFDTGLLGARLRIPSGTIVSGDALFAEYNGALIENHVACALTGAGAGQLHYWTSQGIAEVDFVLETDGEILPIEVKSGLSRKTKSLRVYARKYGARRLFRASPRNFTQDADLVNIPLYAASLLPRRSQNS